MRASKEVIKARREREKQHRIDTILSSAQKVFFEKGFLRSTMDEIALGAEISKPTIYQYFNTKEDLFLSFAIPIIEDLYEVFNTIEARLDNGIITDFKHLIKDMFDRCLQIYKKNPEMFRVLQVFQETKLLFGLDTDVRNEIINKGKTNYQKVRHVFQKAMDKGLLIECDPYPLADIFWGITVGIIQVEDIKGDHNRDHKFKTTAFDMVADIFSNSLEKSSC